MEKDHLRPIVKLIVNILLILSSISALTLFLAFWHSKLWLVFAVLFGLPPVCFLLWVPLSMYKAKNYLRNSEEFNTSIPQID